MLTSVTITDFTIYYNIDSIRILILFYNFVITDHNHYTLNIHISSIVGKHKVFFLAFQKLHMLKGVKTTPKGLN